MMEISVDSLSTAGFAIHVLISLLIFVAWCISIATYTTDGSTTGTATNLYFALCFLTIPALFYLTLTLRFTRSLKWANAYAFTSLDFLFSILWFCAFVALAVFNTDSKCGSTKGCSLSKTLVGMGFFLFAFFAICTAISIKALLYFRSTGVLPGAKRAPQTGGGNLNLNDPDGEAFVTGGEDEYAAVGMKEDGEHSDEEAGMGGGLRRYQQGLDHHANDSGMNYGGSAADIAHHNEDSYGSHDATDSQGAGGLGGILSADHGVVGGHYGGGTFMTPDDVGGPIGGGYRHPYVASEAPYGEEPLHTEDGILQFPAGNYR